MVATALALPLTAASTSGTFALAAAATQIASGQTSAVTVTIPASAVPITPGTVTLDYTRVAGSGSVSSASFAGDWTYSWPRESNIVFTATESVSAMDTVFSLVFSGGATWSVTLRTPQGDFNTQIQVLAPA